MTVALHFTFNIYNIDAVYFDVEEFFNGMLDFKLVSVNCNTEYDLIASICCHSGFLGNTRAFQDLKNALLVHPNNSSNFLTASTVMMVLSKATKLTGSTASTSRTSTLCK